MKNKKQQRLFNKMRRKKSEKIAPSIKLKKKPNVKQNEENSAVY